MLDQFPYMSALESILDDITAWGETRTEVAVSALIFGRGTRRPLS